MQKKYTLEEAKGMLVEGIKKLDENLIIEDIEDKKEVIKIKVKGKKDEYMELGLSNFLAELNSGGNPEQVVKSRLEVMGNFFKQKKIIKDMEKWSFVKDKIIFVPQNKSYCEEINKRMGDKDQIYTKGFIQDIVLMGSIDFPKMSAHMTKNTMKKWKKTEGEIEEQINKNLEKYETKYHIEEVQGMIHIFGAGNVVSPFLIKPKRLREIADKHGLKGKEIVGSVPFRDVITLAEHNMPNALKVWGMSMSMMRDKVRAYPISPKLFMVDRDGVISNFKTDEMPGEGVAFAVDPKNGNVQSMPIGRREVNIDSPSAESMEEFVKTDKGMQKRLSLLFGAAKGMSAEEFAKKMLKLTNDKQTAKEMIEAMIKKGVIIVKNIEGDIRIFPSKRTLDNLLRWR